MNASSIEWTDRTWNPVRGCSRVSEGCRHCYAEKMASRFAGPRKRDVADPDVAVYAGPFAGFADWRGWTGRVELIPSKLDEPLHWKKPARVFVNSMSDLFHERLSDEEIDQVFAVMACAPQHTFQILTKRAERMLDWTDNNQPVDRIESAIDTDRIFDRLRDRMLEGFQQDTWPLPNVWLGVSVEDQATADERIPLLLQTPAEVRFVSYEPALGPVDFKEFLPRPNPNGRLTVTWDEFMAEKVALDWLIVGGESGPGARPFDLAWARFTIAACKAAGVPVFVKQLGAHPCEKFNGSGQSFHHGHPGELLCKKLRDRKGGDPAEWPKDLRIRELPKYARPNARGR